MDPLQKPINNPNNNNNNNNNNLLKRSPSELTMEALYRDESMSRSTAVIDGFFYQDHHAAFSYPTSALLTSDFAFDFKNQELMNGVPNCGGFEQNSSWYNNNNNNNNKKLTPKHPTISGLESQSSICGGSPTSTLKPKTGENQGSGSSEEDEEEAGQCGVSEEDKGVDVKRRRRMVSNRESARRSRKRKQAQLKELEVEVEQLGGENASLFKQLREATQHLKDASTNNRVLKSDVEALRAKVKLAEDMVTRASLSCSLNHLIHTQLNNNTNDTNNTTTNNNNLSPLTTTTTTTTSNTTNNTIIIPAGQDTSSTFSPHNSALLNHHHHHHHHMLNQGIPTTAPANDNASCVSHIWH